MRVLITGGFGYLGGRIAQSLFEQGYQVVLGSRREQTIPTWLPEAKVVRVDWEDQYSLEKICENVDIIIHAAGMNAQDCEKDPQQALVVNRDYTSYLVKASIIHNVKQFIYFSTAHVYSSPLVGTITEDSPTTNSHYYATSHLSGERTLLLESNKGKINGVVVRLANAFGSPTNKDVKCWMLLINDISKQAVTNKKITLHSAGKQMRDFVAIEDVAQVIKYLIRNNNIQNSSIVNFGSGNARTVLSTAEHLQKYCYEMFNYFPEIECLNQSKDINTNKLDFKMNFLNHYKYEFTNNYDKELKELLVFCKNTFVDNSILDR